MGGRPAFVAPAGQQAVNRRDTYEFHDGALRFAVAVPDELGALVAKAEASIIDQRNPERHLVDSAVILASIRRMDELGWDALTRNDRRRLRYLVSALEIDESGAWRLLDPDDRENGMSVLGLISRIVRV